MASVARAIEQAASCTLDAGLWWDSHESLFHSLDHFLSTFRKLPLNQLVKSLQANHTWLLETLSKFKLPNAKSRSALDVSQVIIGDHTLEIKSELRELALQVSKKLVLDEVQAYILVSRCLIDEEEPFPTSYSFEKITLKYYMERQCLLKCVRLLLLAHMSEPSCKDDIEVLVTEAKALVDEGLEDQLFTILEKLLTAEQPLDLDLMFINLWAEQTVVEEHLVMDIIFALYFNSLCICNFVRWKKIFVMFKERVFVGTNIERLSLTAETARLIEHVKHQSVLILLETLDLEKLLVMVYNDAPLSQDRHPFSVAELYQIDGMLNGLNAVEVQEYAPLLLGWGTFVCLVSFLPVQDTIVLNLNHTAYIQQAREGEAFKYLQNMLCHKIMQETNIDGYKYVVKSIISTFIAAFDIIGQNDMATMDIIIDILYLVYSGQEILCSEFWDKENILDGPLRSLLYSLRQHFPYQIKLLVKLLAGLAEGSWPAECVYTFLYRPSEIACLHQVDKNIPINGQPFDATVAIPVPGVPGLVIPSGMAGQCLRVLEDQTCIVLWKCKHSAIVVLLLHLAELVCAGNSWDQAHGILSLLQRMLLSNKMLAKVLLELNNAEVCEQARADGRMEVTARVDFLSVIRMLLGKLLDVSDSIATAAICTNLLGVYADCCSERVALELGKSQSTWSLREQGLLTKLSSSICRDLEPSKGKHLLIISVLDLCKSLVNKGAYSESLCEMVLHVIGTLFFKHTTSRNEQKYERWKITAKILELAHLILSDSKPSMSQLKARVFNLIIQDPGFHSILLRILSVNMADLQGLYFNLSVELKDIEWFEETIKEGLRLLNQALKNLMACPSFEECRSSSSLEQGLLHHTIGTMPFVECVASLVGCVQNQALQLASIELLTTMCFVAGLAKPHPLSVSSYIQGFEQKESLQRVFAKLVSEENGHSNKELFKSSVDFLTVATKHQPSFVQMVFSLVKDNSDKDVHKNSVPVGDAHEKKPDSTLVESIWNIFCQPYIFESHPQILSTILLFMRCLWEGSSNFPEILASFRKRDGFWTVLTSYISKTSSVCEGVDDLLLRASQYRCRAFALQIFSWEFFLQKQTDLYQGDHYNYIEVDKNETHGILQGSAHIFSPAMIQFLQAIDPAKLIELFAIPLYEKEVVVRSKADMQILLVGLMLRVLSADTLGLSVAICEFLQHTLKSVLNHASFQKLLGMYLSQGYGHGKELYVLVMSDLYFHMQGELEAGRHIPTGCFQDLVHFLDAVDLSPIFRSSKGTLMEELLSEKGLLYNMTVFRQHVGIEWWSETTWHAIQTAEKTLTDMEQANFMICLGDSQLAALESLTGLFCFFMNHKGQVDAKSLSNWKDACIVEVCSSIESSLELLGPDGDPTQYIQSFILTQLKLLLVLLQWFSISVKQDTSKACLNRICVKVINTLVAAAKPIMTSCIVAHTIETTGCCLLGAYLICLELLQFQNQSSSLQESESMGIDGPNSTTLSNVMFKCAEVLPFACLLVENKCQSSLAISVVCIIINQFLAPQIWLPILQTHSTVGSCLSLLHTAEDTEGAFQILNLFLSLSHVRSGVEMLQSAGIVSHILIFVEKSKQESSHGDCHGPFCVSKARSRKRELWGLSVAIVAAVVQALGEYSRDNAIESAFSFLQSQKGKMLDALQSPGVSIQDGCKGSSFGPIETAISSLQKTQQVLHLMVVLIKHHAQWFHVMGPSETDFRHKCIHLLAYIAKEGLLRNVNSNLKTSFHCYPITKEEFSAHQMASMLNSSAGWFGLAAKGAAFISKIDPSKLSSQTKRPSSAQLETRSMVPTMYSDSIALHVYKLALLLLDLFCKQAQKAVMLLNDSCSLNYRQFPEFPAPEILYSMQEQVMSVITDLCTNMSTTPIRKEAQETCCLLLSIMEKTLVLEAFVSRICGTALMSVRAEELLRDYKALVTACEGHHFLNASLKALKPVVSMVYPVSSEVQ